MGTKDENYQSEDSCWNKAFDDEQIFVLLGRDRHAPALIRLWAAMRDKEGENPEVVAEALGVAQLMEDEAQAAGRIVLSLDAVASFATTFKAGRQEAQEAALVPQTTAGTPGSPNVGDIVVAGRGRPAKLVRIFDNKAPEAVQGMANIQVPGYTPVTVTYDTLRRALPDEVEAYLNSGGRM